MKIDRAPAGGDQRRRWVTTGCPLSPQPTPTSHVTPPPSIDLSNRPTTTTVTVVVRCQNEERREG
ncbi:hypothetical protein HanXRQr2_Chr12g0533851 [Helianthus annuus]|uniref:Uncharacterized protein n=1 Tax=Helianthus annuus TaxID=4232 RepID=A0A251T1B3_HELAN|nr:hypothetical protein HanXRQr2_Chr12g0533851 [Helianthus annuus]KAJ0488845.1 hypothetical protein HanHA300_Chr12g0437381 [Helianthus annuus]KAJ0492437.1 hypothetical protein HanIR_Chr12g0574911 [Helianthus annuus]KAJ0504688.1 hypothetical protein HanHA89_Chr12g0462071 [Helianthus annuus]KAJ0674417.1 hypothetical protein HanLR1_Chr12g0439721 [Helianthus annuus]